jgi:hypothetical protein
VENTWKFLEKTRMDKKVQLSLSPYLSLIVSCSFIFPWEKKKSKTSHSCSSNTMWKYSSYKHYYFIITKHICYVQKCTNIHLNVLNSYRDVQCTTKKTWETCFEFETTWCHFNFCWKMYNQHQNKPGIVLKSLA